MNNLLSGLIGAVIGGVLAGVPAFLAYLAARRANQLASDSNETAREALTVAKQATSRSRQYALLDRLRTAVEQLRAELERTIQSLGEAVNTANDGWPEWIEGCNAHMVELDAFYLHLIDLRGKLQDDRLVSLTKEIADNGQTIQAAVREAGRAGDQIHKAILSEDKPSERLGVMALGRAGEQASKPYGSARAAIDDTLAHLDKLEREGW